PGLNLWVIVTLIRHHRVDRAGEQRDVVLRQLDIFVFKLTVAFCRNLVSVFSYSIGRTFGTDGSVDDTNLHIGLLLVSTVVPNLNHTLEHIEGYPGFVIREALTLLTSDFI